MAPATPPHRDPIPFGVESVAFATGNGRLVRRATAVLFDPTGQNPKLSSAFDDAGDDNAAIDQVLHTVVEAALVAAPFAIVQWADDLELLVFGDIELHTSCPSAPMITGAGSVTWVQHRVARELVDAGPSPQVWSGDPAEPDTNLRLGIAACAGFRLDLIADAAQPPATEPLAAPIVEEPIRVWTDAENDAGPVDEHHVHDDDTDADPFALPVDAAAVAPPGDSVTSATAELLEFDAAPEPSVEAPEQRPASATAEQTAPLALLIFDDRADIAVRATSVLGRRPQSDADQALIAIDHPEVSRTHAEIDTGEGRGKVATIRDLGSRNGTWVQSPGGAGLRRLDADERALLLPGTIVHLGSVEVCFTWKPIDAIE